MVERSTCNLCHAMVRHAILAMSHASAQELCHTGWLAFKHAPATVLKLSISWVPPGSQAAPATPEH
jgi:hypothetical protein